MYKRNFTGSGLIIAGAVLMMTGLTVMYLFTDVAKGTNDDIELTKCRQAVRGLCATTENVRQAPSTCTNSEGNVPSNVASQVQGLSTSGTVTCSI